MTVLETGPEDGEDSNGLRWVNVVGFSFQDLQESEVFLEFAQEMTLSPVRCTL